MKKFLVRLIVGMGLVGLFTNTARAQWVQTNGPYGGDIRALAASGSTIFAGTWGGGVFLSTNNGMVWATVNSGFTNTYVVSLAISGGTIFAGTVGGGVFLSINNGTSWTAVNSGLTNSIVQSLAVSGSNIFTGTAGGIFLSTNNGTSWTAVDSGLSDTYVSSLAVSGSTIFIGTDTGGVFLSTNNGTSWYAINAGITCRDVLSLAVSGSNIFAGTEGGGVWRRPLSEVTGVINHKPNPGLLTQLNFKIHSPSHANPSATIEFSLPHSDQVTLEIYNLYGREIKSLVNKNLGPGSHRFFWDTRTIASGCYAVRMQVGTNTFVKSMMLSR